MTLDNESKQKQRRKRTAISPARGDLKRDKRGDRTQKIVAQVQEDDCIIEVEAEGETEEFLSEVDPDSQESGKFAKSKTRSGRRFCQDDVLRTAKQAEVVLRIQTNNNALLVDADEDEEIAQRVETTEEDEVDYEDGECVDDTSGKNSGPGTIAGQEAIKQSTQFEADKENKLGKDSVNDITLLSNIEETGVTVTTTAMAAEYIDKRIDNSLSKVQDYFDKKFENLTWVMELERQLDANRRQMGVLKQKGMDSLMGRTTSGEQDTHSELTIYSNAVDKKWGSSSSEDDMIDTSDELIEDMSQNISECELAEGSQHETQLMNDPRPDISYAEDVWPERDRNSKSGKVTAEESVEKLVKDAEESRARVYDVSGRQNTDVNIDNMNSKPMSRDMSSVIDEDYMLVASHIDDTIRQKIINNEYVDFGKLLRKNKTNDEDHQKMVMVNKGGMSYWLPMNDKNSVISGYMKWDLAFRVYLDIYATHHPERTSELIQYSHIIQTAAMSYSWDNVYLYDREFRRHMARHPSHSWGGDFTASLDHVLEGQGPIYPKS